MAEISGFPDRSAPVGGSGVPSQTVEIQRQDFERALRESTRNDGRAGHGVTDRVVISSAGTERRSEVIQTPAGDPVGRQNEPDRYRPDLGSGEIDTRRGQHLDIEA